MIKKIIQNSILFQGVEEEYIHQLLDDPKSIHAFQSGDFIVSQGEEGNGMYFIMEGEVEIIVENKTPAEKKLIRLLQKGEFFGEICMFAKQNRIASARAKTDVKAAYLDSNRFREQIKAENTNAMRIGLNITYTLIDHLRNMNKVLAELDKQLQSSSGSEISRFKNKLMKEILI